MINLWLKGARSCLWSFSMLSHWFCQAFDGEQDDTDKVLFFVWSQNNDKLERENQIVLFVHFEYLSIDQQWSTCDQNSKVWTVANCCDCAQEYCM